MEGGNNCHKVNLNLSKSGTCVYSFKDFTIFEFFQIEFM